MRAKVKKLVEKPDNDPGKLPRVCHSSLLIPPHQLYTYMPRIDFRQATVGIEWALD